MQIEHTEQILAILASFYPLDLSKPSLIEVWHQALDGMEPEEGLKAAKRLLEEHRFEKIKPADLWSYVKRARMINLPESLTITPDQALTDPSYEGKLLTQKAIEYADRAVPSIDPRRSFESPQELDRALAIRAAQWDRAFKEEYQRLKDKALIEIENGAEPKKAILISAGAIKALDSGVKNLIDSVISIKTFQEILTPEVPKATIEKFYQYHSQNPKTWELFRKVAKELIDEGRSRIGAKMIFERIREKCTSNKDPEYALNNVYAPYYARLYAALHPQHKDKIEFRTLKGIAA